MAYTYNIAHKSHHDPYPRRKKKHNVQNSATAAIRCVATLSRLEPFSTKGRAHLGSNTSSNMQGDVHVTAQTQPDIFPFRGSTHRVSRLLKENNALNTTYCMCVLRPIYRHARNLFCFTDTRDGYQIASTTLDPNHHMQSVSKAFVAKKITLCDRSVSQGRLRYLDAIASLLAGTKVTKLTTFSDHLVSTKLNLYTGQLDKSKVTLMIDVFFPLRPARDKGVC